VFCILSPFSPRACAATRDLLTARRRPVCVEDGKTYAAARNTDDEGGAAGASRWPVASVRRQSTLAMCIPCRGCCRASLCFGETSSQYRRTCFGLRVIVPWWRSSSCRSRLLRPATSAWHSVGDDGAVCGGLLSTPLPGCGGVAFCCVSCVRCLCGGGVHFGV